MPKWTMPRTIWKVLCRHEGANTDIARNIRVSKMPEWMVWMALCRREGAKKRILQAISEWKRLWKRQNSRLSNAATDPVSLKVLSWNVAGLAEDCTDIFPVADFNARRFGCITVARMFPQTGWVDVGGARIVHAVRTLGRIAMSGSHCQSEMERTIEDCRGCGKMDCGRAGWTADPHFSILASQRKQTGRIRGILTELQEFLNGRPKQHVILGGDFNVKMFGMTDYLHVGESIPRPRTLINTNDSLRARALHTMVTELDLTVTNTWMNADTERELFTRSSWSNPEQRTG